MKVFDAEVSSFVFRFLKDHAHLWETARTANDFLQKVCGIRGFFSDDTEIHLFAENIKNTFADEVCESPAEYGDYQTNPTLALQITQRLKANGSSPQIIIEPTCGKGNFIIAALNTFDTIEKIYGIEIQEKHIWQAKFNILEFFLNNPEKVKPEITIYHSSIFDFDYYPIKKIVGNKDLLIIGNPPWVTNSALSAMDSLNIPKKTNFKQHKGLDALTGKGNFDIAEYITIDLLRNFGNCNGSMVFLVKNTVIKNLVYSLPQLQLKIADLKKQNIDSKKEFNVSVDASVFFCQLNKETEYSCQEADFYTSEKKCVFGWRNSKFMSDLSCEHDEIDGVSPFEWRQGIKHDCSKVMEIVSKDDFYTNKLGEVFNLEDDLIYPLLKSSDLKSSYAEPTQRRIIVTQKSVGQDTSYIRNFPKTLEYLNNHKNFFQLRKSSIYKGKNNFSIFGIGSYSFKPYKIAISGLYKSFHFCLVKPQDGKPVMLDDTCYFIGFDTFEQAEFVWRLLNTELVTNFLKSISFKDAKRMITKEILMRIDLKKVAKIEDIDPSLFDKKEGQLDLFENA